MLFVFLLLFTGIQTLQASEKGSHFGHLTHDLNLSDQQKAQVETLRKERKKSWDQYKDKQALIEKLNKALQSEAADDDVRKLHDELMTARSAMEKERLEFLLSLRKILTPEQRKKLRLPGRGRLGPKGKNSKHPHADEIFED